MSMIRTDNSDFKAAIEGALSELVSADHRDGFAFVRTPLTYPSGAQVVVRVSAAGPRYFVTDFGLGYDEADMMGGAMLYPRHARPIAENAGVRFDTEAFFVMEVERGQLAGAIGAIAGCSHEAVALTAYKLADRRASDIAERLFDRLVHIFSPSQVAKNASLHGASNTEYRVDALVSVGRKPTIFEAVSNHHTSVFAANSKFADISLLEKPPILVSVVRKKKDLGTYFNLLAQSSHVIEADVPDESITKLAKAA